MNNSGFIDLRQHGQGSGSHSDDSVWPSFTDIMTVVVMVFLMALVAILVRNNELVAQLKSTMQAEQLAAEQARTTAQQKATLETRLGSLESEISSLTSNLDKTTAEREQTARTLEDKVQRIEALVATVGGLNDLKTSLESQTAALTAQREALTQEKTNLTRDKLALIADKNALSTELAATGDRAAQLEVEREQLTGDRSKLDEALALLQGRYGELEAQQLKAVDENKTLSETLDELKATVTELNKEKSTLVVSLDSAEQGLKSQKRASEAEVRRLAVQIKQLQQNMNLLSTQKTELASEVAQSKQALKTRDSELASARAQATSAVTSLQGQFDELQLRYDKLVRPARSAAGRTVVDIRHFKKNGVAIIEYRMPGQTTFTVVTRQKLEQELDKLKALDASKLYTRIIFPEDSGLSYNEAFDFETGILNKYDYYY